jgi:hypothetical protein
MTYQNLGYWVGQANDLSTGTHPTGWTNGQRWSETSTEWQAMYDAMLTNYNNSQAALSAMTTDRNYWKTTVAHDDPDVWNTRYNAGYSAGAGSKTTTAVSAGTAGTGGLSGSYSGDLGSVVCPRTGLAHVSCRVGSNGDDAAIHIFKNGVLAIAGASANGGLNTTFAVQGNVSVNAGDTISVRATGDGSSGLQTGVLLVTVGSV